MGKSAVSFSNSFPMARAFRKALAMVRYQIRAEIRVLSMTMIVRAVNWSQFVGIACSNTGFARHRNATTGDATLSKRLSPTVVACATANRDLTVIL